MSPSLLQMLPVSFTYSQFSHLFSTHPTCIFKDPGKKCGSGTLRYAVHLLVDSSYLLSLELPNWDHSTCFQHKKGNQNSLLANSGLDTLSRQCNFFAIDFRELGPQARRSLSYRSIFIWLLVSGRCPCEFTICFLGLVNQNWMGWPATDIQGLQRIDMGQGCELPV